jgi:hypothetical protein
MADCAQESALFTARQPLPHGCHLLWTYPLIGRIALDTERASVSLPADHFPRIPFLIEQVRRQRPFGSPPALQVAKCRQRADAVLRLGVFRL